MQPLNWSTIGRRLHTRINTFQSQMQRQINIQHQFKQQRQPRQHQSFKQQFAFAQTAQNRASHSYSKSSSHSNNNNNNNNNNHQWQYHHTNFNQSQSRGANYNSNNSHSHSHSHNHHQNYRFSWQQFSRGFRSQARRLGAQYSAVLEEYPYTTNCITSGLLGFAGDATTQALEHKWDAESERTPKPWDWRRLFAVSFFGVAFMGPIGHIWYQQLERFCVKYCTRKAASIAIKVCGDTFLFGPVCLWAFFVSVSLMEGTPWRRTEQKIRRDFVPTYIVDYSMWPVVQGLNFRFVPVQHQLLVVNLMCYFDDIFLSYVQHNSLPRMFQLIEDWWERVLYSEKYAWLGVTAEGISELDRWEKAQEDAQINSWKASHPAFGIEKSATSIASLQFLESKSSQSPPAAVTPSGADSSSGHAR